MSDQTEKLLSALRNAAKEVERLRSEKQSLVDSLKEPIAVIGIGCRFPGGVTSPESFWRLLDDGIDAITEVPPARWDVDAWYDPDTDARGKMTTRWGGFVPDLDRFEPAFFGLSPREAASIDPQERLLLETSWEALEHAGQTPERLMGTDTAVYMGLCGTEYQALTMADAGAIDAYALLGTAHSAVAGRLSYWLGFKGPNLAVDTACSSSLVSVHLACQALRLGECSMALAGGANVLLSPETTVYFSRLRAMSPTGRCHAFAAEADGYVRGEGCGVVVLKRLSDAQRDGDAVLAVIRGSAINQDGRSQGMTAPNGPSQQAVIRRALDQAGVLPAEVGYVECHGTGTPLGDPIEVQALGAALAEGRAADRPVVIGSVKSNIGHTEGAAGVAGLIKAVLALEHGRIPKNLHFTAPNPYIPWAELPVKVAAEAVEWPRNGTPRRAGVSSFGFSGTNAHVVLEEAPISQIDASPVAEASSYLLPISAKSPEALHALVQSLAKLLAEVDGPRLSDLVYTASVRRSHHEHRLTVVGQTREEMAEALSVLLRGGAFQGRAARTDSPKVVFVFPGQGSQWIGMGRQLLATELAFRSVIEACDEVIRLHGGFSVLEQLGANEELSRLHEIDVVQPVLFAVEVALAALWRSWGVEPDAVIGHSMGEVAAAHVAGILSLEDAAKVICRRSRLLRRVTGKGAMGLIELGMAEARTALSGYEDRLSIAVNNGPRSTVISGDPAALEDVLRALEAQRVFCRRVKVDVASHSPQMDPLREDLLAALGDISPRPAQLNMRSTVTGETLTGLECDASYWVKNLREPVLFSNAAQHVMDERRALLVEMSPHPILLPSIEENLKEKKHAGAAIGSLRRKSDERRAMLESLGALWVQGYPISWERLFPAGGRCVPLPTYPWQRERYWIETPANSVVSDGRRAHAGGHPLLGEAQTLSTQTSTRLWETTLDRTRLPWLGDHRVQGAIVFPGAGYLEMALASGAERLEGAAVQLTDVMFEQALTLADDAPVTVQLVTTEESPGRLRFQIASRASGRGRSPWTRHARGTVERVEREVPRPRLDLGALRARLGAAESAPSTYATMAARGLEYGPAFQGIAALWHGQGEALGRVQLSTAVGSASAFQIHPALLDACLQVMAGTVDEGDATPWVPVGVGSLRLLRQPSGELWCHARLTDSCLDATHRRSADLFVVDATGAPVAELRGLVIQRLAATTTRSEQDDWFLELDWEPSAVPAPTTDAGRWLLLWDGGGVGSALRASLEAAGHGVVHAVPTEASSSGLRACLSSAFGPQGPTAVVHLGSLDVDGTVLDAETMEKVLMRGCDSVLATVQALAGMGFRDAPRLWLVTRGAQAVGSREVAALHAPLLGLSRVIALEHGALRCARVDLDPARPTSEVQALLAELLADDAEDEVALRGEERRVARLVRSRPETERRESIEPARGRPFRLGIDEPGVLDRLVLRAMGRRAPGPGEVEIAVEAAGLNFLDVLLAMGVMPDDVPSEPGAPLRLGGECAGRIVAVGDGVEGLAVGQSVIAVVLGAFASHVTTSATLVLPRPVGLSASDAAAMPVAYLTAWYALDRVARLQRGERVLIHAATGGVGLAAVQWAQHVGAEVYATAGSPEKRAYLESLGVKYVSDSRSDQFISDVQSWTRGEGVDVVLNSLSGEFIGKSFMLLRSHGRFVELGKRDYYADNQLGLRPFLRNLSFSLVDLRGMTIERPAWTRALLKELLSLISAGAFTPPPVTSIPISRATEAFRKMAQAQHIGKLVLTLEEPEVRIQIPTESGMTIRPDGSYLVTGGLGGLGLSVAGWLAQRGAGHLVLAGRSGAKTVEQQAAVAALRGRGARVTVARADVADRVQVEQILRQVAESGMPLRGVIHAAGRLDDGLLLQQTPARLRAVMASKMWGALHLHTLTRTAALDFFVLYASGAGLLGSPGQGNYAAANTFLDALAHHRRAQGLPALSVDWGAFSEVGLAAAQENRAARLVSRGLRSLTPDEGLSALERLLEGGRAQVGVMPLDVRQWVEFYPASASSRMLSRLVAEQRAGAGRSAGNRDLLVRLAAAGPGERAALLLEVLRGLASEVLRIPDGKLEVEAPLTSLGMDSLMGLELRNRVEVALGIKVSATLLWTYPTVAALSVHLAGRADFVESGEAVPPADTRQVIPVEHDEVTQLDKDDLLALLNEELALAGDQ